MRREVEYDEKNSLTIMIAKNVLFVRVVSGAYNRTEIVTHSTFQANSRGKRTKNKSNFLYGFFTETY